MKKITTKIIAIVLCLVLSLSAFALAENGKPSMDGFNEAENWYGSFHGLGFSIPSYFEEDQESTQNQVWLYVKGITLSNGYAPAILSLMANSDSYTREEFMDFKETILSQQIQTVDGTATHYIENCTIANCPATGTQFTYEEDDGGSWINRTYLIYNEFTSEIIKVTLLESMDAPADFMDDFEKIIDSITLLSADEASDASSGQDQVSPGLKQICDDYINAIDQVYTLMKEAGNIEDIGIIDAVSILTKLEKITPAIDAFNNVDASALSEADSAYYVSVQSGMLGDAMSVALWLGAIKHTFTE